MENLPHKFEKFGIQSWHGSSLPMERIHSHTEIELNLVEKGALHYVFGNEEITLPAGSLYVFSGIQPHRLVKSSPGTVYSWLTIPASHFAEWKLQGELAERILSGNIEYDDDPVEFERDPVRFARWRQDLEKGKPQYLRIILLEVRARLERLALTQSEGQKKITSRQQQNWSNPVALMTVCILKRLTDCELTLQEIADSAHLNASYASTLFRRKTGQSPIEFLTEQRLSYARILLATTENKVIDVALESGFGSSSQFYASFKKRYGYSPSSLRK